MKSAQTIPAKSGINMSDIFYALFQHKWMILFLTFLGVGVAAGLWVKRKPFYQSEAKLMVRYVIDRRSFDTGEEQASTGGSRSADSVMNSELEILKSGDLALQVAAIVGPDRLLPETKSPPSVADAAAAIVGGLEAKAAPNNKVIHVNFRSHDPDVTTVVLQELVERYFEKHFEIHRSVGAFDTVAKQTEEVQSRLKETESKLNELKAKHGIISLLDATTSFGSQRARAQEDLNTAEAEYAEQKAKVKALEELIGVDESSGAGDRANGPSNQRGTLRAVDPNGASEYRALLEFLGTLQKRDSEFRLKWKDGNMLIVLNQQQIQETEAKLHRMRENNPSLVATGTVENGSPADPRAALEEAQVRLSAISAKLEVFKSQLADLQNQFKALSEIGMKIENLSRQKEIEDAEYRLLESNLKRAKIDMILDPSQMPNIKMVQQPSTPVKAYSAKTNKIIVAIAGSGLVAGVGLAFLIELVLDRRVKRPMEIESRLQLPLLMSIPLMRSKGRSELLLANNPDVEVVEHPSGQSYPLIRGRETNDPFLLAPDHFMLPYSQAIRDRIVFNFGVNHVNHKPKLIGLTGLSEGAGTSTIAAGLAKSFAEAHGVKVLLVDLNANNSGSNSLFKGSRLLSLSQALHIARDGKFKEDGQNLYLASTEAENGMRSFAPIHLQQLMPLLHSSEFDYIIFDLPVMNNTSPTLAMAGLLDKVLLVLDAEDTSREDLKWGYAALVKGKADVSCVFNKAKPNTPRWAAGEG